MAFPFPRPATDSPRSPSKRDKSARRRRARSARAARHRPPQSLRTDLMLKHSSMLDRAPSARQVHRTAALGYARRTGLDLCARCAPIAFMRSQRRKKLKQTNAPGITECAGSTGGAYALTPHTFAWGMAAVKAAVRAAVRTATGCALAALARCVIAAAAAASRLRLTRSSIRTLP